MREENNQRNPCRCRYPESTFDACIARASNQARSASHMGRRTECGIPADDSNIAGNTSCPSPTLEPLIHRNLNPCCKLTTESNAANMHMCGRTHAHKQAHTYTRMHTHSHAHRHATTHTHGRACAHREACRIQCRPKKQNIILTHTVGGHAFGHRTESKNRLRPSRP